MGLLSLPAPGLHLAGALRRHLEARPALERALITVALLVSWTAGYQAVGRGVDPARAITLATPLDGAIPFEPWAVYLYGLAYVGALYPVFVIEDRALFRATAAAYALLILIALVTFAAFPVTVVGLRPSLADLPPAALSSWATRLVYELDPPTNACPSLHVGLACMAALAVWRAQPALALVPVAIALGTIAGVLLLKQHYIADAVAALACVAVAYAATLGRFRPPDERPLARSWRSAAAFLLFSASLYGGVALAFAAGLPT